MKISGGFYYECIHEVLQMSNELYNFRIKRRHFSGCAKIPSRTASVCESCLSYEGVYKSFRTGRLERELQVVQLFATRCSCIAIMWVSSSEFCHHKLLYCFSTTVYFCCCLFRYDSVRELFGTPSYAYREQHLQFCNAANCSIVRLLTIKRNSNKWNSLRGT
jgi:hypothetical protein